MQGFCEPFEGKKITLMGLGLLGRGVGDAEFLAGCGAEVLVTDKKSEPELAESVARLKKFSNISYHLGGHKLEDFTNIDMVIKAAGVPLDSPEIAAAQKANVPVYMSTALFAKYAAEAGATIVGVTGTRGKTTTAQMIYEVLKAAGKKVLLGGNVRGISTLAMLPEVQKDTMVVLELDSWQLQGFGDLEISPKIAVFTNFYPDHMNYYKNDMDAYFADKAKIFLHQQPGDILVVGYDIQQRMLEKNLYPKSNVFVADMHDILGWKFHVLGNHNRQNAACAIKVAQELGIEEEIIQRTLESFKAVSGRLEFIREVNGVKIYNDNNSTTPEATVAGLMGVVGLVGNKEPIILIMGGSDKGLDMSMLVREANHIADKIILLKGTGTEKLTSQYTMKRQVVVDSLKQALNEAFEYAKSQNRGGVILFSPAFASFGMFKNEYDRNDEFVRLVNDL